MQGREYMESLKYKIEVKEIKTVSD